MKKSKTESTWNLEQDYQLRIRPLLATAPWVLRITDLKDKPSPVLVIKERYSTEAHAENQLLDNPKGILKDRGLLYGASLRRCIPVIKLIIKDNLDEAGIPINLDRFFSGERISFRGNIPLDKASGAKLALIFKLQERVADLDRVELIAWRVERFTPEEALYWLSRATHFGDTGNRWAQAGMRIMLGGQPKDSAVMAALNKIRH